MSDRQPDWTAVAVSASAREEPMAALAAAAISIAEELRDMNYLLSEIRHEMRK